MFAVEEAAVTVLAFEAAFPMKFLARADYTEVPDREAQLAFLDRWPAGVGKGLERVEKAGLG